MPINSKEATNWTKGSSSEANTNASPTESIKHYGWWSARSATGYWVLRPDGENWREGDSPVYRIQKPGYPAKDGIMRGWVQVNKKSWGSQESKLEAAVTRNQLPWWNQMSVVRKDNWPHWEADAKTWRQDHGIAISTSQEGRKDVSMANIPLGLEKPPTVDWAHLTLCSKLMQDLPPSTFHRRHLWLNGIISQKELQPSRWSDESQWWLPTMTISISCWTAFRPLVNRQPLPRWGSCFMVVKEFSIAWNIPWH